MSEWAGENPFYLLIRHPQVTDGKMVATIIDLDEPGWMDRHSDITELPGRWFLVHKETKAMPIAVLVNEGERAYYKARHVGVGAGTPDAVLQAEVIAYGIGKEKADGTHDQLWHFFPGNITCAGDDVNPIGIEVLKMTNAMKHVEKKAREIAASRVVDSKEPTTPPSGDTDTE